MANTVSAQVRRRKTRCKACTVWLTDQAEAIASSSGEDPNDKDAKSKYDAILKLTQDIYGKEASAYYDIFSGLRHLIRGDAKPRPVATENNDTIREELDEFVHCARTGAKPETDGWWASRNLAVIKAGVKSAKEGRVVSVNEVLESGE